MINIPVQNERRVFFFASYDGYNDVGKTLKKPGRWKKGKQKHHAGVWDDDNDDDREKS
jgi:hypothetical protein